MTEKEKTGFFSIRLAPELGVFVSQVSKAMGVSRNQVIEQAVIALMNDTVGVLMTTYRRKLAEQKQKQEEDEMV